MNSICVSPDFVVLRFSSIMPDSRGTASAVRRALISEGFAPWKNSEAEVFTAGGQTLIIARPSQKNQISPDSTV